jgi:hypothetical protein
MVFSAYTCDIDDSSTWEYYTGFKSQNKANLLYAFDAFWAIRIVGIYGNPLMKTPTHVPMYNGMDAMIPNSHRRLFVMSCSIADRTGIYRLMIDPAVTHVLFFFVDILSQLSRHTAC